MRRSLLREVREELDLLRGAVLDGSLRKDYDHSNLRGSGFRRHFLRAKVYIRGTAQWEKSDRQVPRVWSLSTVFAHLTPPAKKQLEGWLEGVARDDSLDLEGQEHLLTG